MKRLLLTIVVLASIGHGVTMAQTPCDTMTLPYNENFQVQNGLPPCWTVVRGDSLYDAYYPSVFVGRLQFLCSDTGWCQWVTLPAVPADAMAVNLSLHIVTTFSQELEVGIMTDPTDTTTYTPLYSLVNHYAGQNLWISFDGTTARHIALRCRNTSPNYSPIVINDLTVRAAPSCPATSGLQLSAVDSTWASIRWDEAVVDHWIVSVDGGLPIDTDTNTLELTDLLPNSSHHIELRAVCPLGDTTDPAVLDFYTLCGLFSLPFADNFDAYQYGSLPNCWTYAAHNSSIDGFMGSRYIKLNYTNDSIPASIASPAIFTNGDRMHVGFDMMSSYGGTLQAGILADVDGADLFIPLLSIETAYLDYGGSSNWLHYDFYTDTVTTLAADVPVRIAFRWMGSGHSNLYIDNVTAAPVGDCHAPSSVHIDTAYANVVSLSWEDYSLVPQPYEVKAYVVDDSAATAEVFYTEATSITLNTLQPTQQYILEVRSLCPDDSTRWILAGYVFTSCGDINLPYRQNFDFLDNGDTVPCWLQYPATSRWTVSNGTLLVNYARYYYADTNTIATPTIAAPPDELFVSFDYVIISPNTTLDVGFTVADDTTFHPITSFSIHNNYNYNWTHVEFYTDTVTIDTLARLAFRISKTAESPSVSAKIDNLVILRSNGCRHPVGVDVSHILSSEATVHVLDTLNTGTYHLYLQHNGQTESVFIFDSVGQLLPLEPGTLYTVTAAAVCAENVESFALASTSFSTGCSPLSHFDLPYLQNFEDLVPQPELAIPCWNFHYTSPNSYYHNDLFVSDSNTVLRLMASQQPSLAVLPEVDSLRDLFLEFDMRIDPASSGQIEVGIMDHPHELSSFSPVAIIGSDPSGLWKHYQIPFDEYTGQGRFVAFRVSDNSILVDNTVLDRIPDCSRRISNLAVGNVWSYCADLSWQVDLGRNANSYFIINVIDGNGNPNGRFYADASPFTICNLDELSDYRVWVELFCGGDIQAVSDTIHFTTLCDNIQGVEISHYNLHQTVYTLPNLPLSNSRYSASQQLFDVYDLAGQESDMAGIEIEYYGYAPSYDIKFCTIYVAHTESDSLAGWAPLGDMVYAGSLHLTPGWNTIYFNQPIHHYADSNLVLTFVCENTPIATDALFLGYINRAGGAYVYRSDTAAFNTSKPAQESYNRSNVRFLVCPNEMPQCNMPRILSLSSTSNSVTMTYNSAENCEVQITSNQYWTASDTGILASGGTYTFHNLDPHTHYIVGVRRPCASGYSPWHVDHIATSIPDCPTPPAPSLAEVDSRNATLLFDSQGASRWQVRVFNYLIDTIFTTAEASVSLHNLAPTVAYHACMRLLCDFNSRSPWSDTLTFVTSHCRDIANARVSPVGPSAVSVSWNGGDSDNATEPDRYSVMYGLHDFLREEAIDTIVTADQSVTIEGLDMNGKSYDFFVMSHCPDGTSSVWTMAGTYPPYNSDTVGIDLANVDAAVAIYPNPASTSVTVDVAQAASVTLLDLNGRTLFHSALPATKHLIDTSTLPRGTYFVRITAVGSTTVRKLVIM